MSFVGKITRERLEKFMARHASDEFTLDVGCANSPYSRYFRRRIGLDLGAGEGVDVLGDAHSLPFASESFDRILCTEVLEHLHTPMAGLLEMQRVLKRGGRLLLTTRFLFPLHETPRDYFRFTKYGLRELFKRGWEIEELAEEADTADTLAVLVQRIALQSQFIGGKATAAVVLALARLAEWLPWPIRKQYGNQRESREEPQIMTSGYYVACRKL